VWRHLRQRKWKSVHKHNNGENDRPHHGVSEAPSKGAPRNKVTILYIRYIVMKDVLNMVGFMQVSIERRGLTFESKIDKCMQTRLMVFPAVWTSCVHFQLQPQQITEMSGQQHTQPAGATAAASNPVIDNRDTAAAGTHACIDFYLHAIIIVSFITDELSRSFEPEPTEGGSHGSWRISRGAPLAYYWGPNSCSKSGPCPSCSAPHAPRSDDHLMHHWW
jgi:hypothetical protein